MIIKILYNERMAIKHPSFLGYSCDKFCSQVGNLIDIKVTVYSPLSH